MITFHMIIKNSFCVEGSITNAEDLYCKQTWFCESTRHEFFFLGELVIFKIGLGSHPLTFASVEIVEQCLQTKKVFAVKK